MGLQRDGRVSLTLGWLNRDQHTQHIVDTGFGNEQTVPLSRKIRERTEFVPPLTGLKVIDATQGYTGPYVGLMLAEAGAEVIKIEPKGA